MIIVDTTIKVDNTAKLIDAVMLAQKKPIYVELPKQDADDMKITFIKSLLLFKTVEENDKYEKLLLLAPELLFKIDKMINQKSHWLANPNVIETIFRLFPISSIEQIGTPEDLANFLANGCKNNYNFHLLISRESSSEAFIICVNGILLAVVFVDSTITYGIKALRYIFFKGPYLGIRYKIKIEELEK